MGKNTAISTKRYNDSGRDRELNKNVDIAVDKIDQEKQQSYQISRVCGRLSILEREAESMKGIKYILFGEDRALNC